MDFPQSPHLVVGEGSQVAILTLWTKKEHVLSKIPAPLYAVASQLYSRDEGLSLLVRGLLYHKNIRDVIVVGVDLNHCADALFALWKNGVQNGQVIGAGGFVDVEVASEAIDRLREAVTLHDLRAERDYTAVRAYIEQLEKKDAWGDPEEFPEPVFEKPRHFPTQQQHCVFESTIRRASIRLAQLYDRFGELHNVQAHITEPGPHVLSEKDQDAYTDSFLYGVTDTYPKPLAEELTLLTSLLTKQKSAAVRVLPQDPAKITTLQIYHADGLHLACFVDQLHVEEFSFLCSALFSALELVAAELHLATGTVTVCASIVTSSDPSFLQELLETKLPVRKIGDPKSNMLIRLRADRIQVTHLSPSGKRLEQFSGTSARELYLRIIQENRVSDLSHAAYIGYELARAEQALASGGMYEQDTV